MAKSTRSKVKRSFRAKKREEGVYAAVEAARLDRLHSKLKAVQAADKDGDIEVREGAEDDAGSSWFLLFGLVEPGSIGIESMARFEEAMCRRPVSSY